MGSILSSLSNTVIAGFLARGFGGDFGNVNFLEPAWLFCI